MGFFDKLKIKKDDKASSKKPVEKKKKARVKPEVQDEERETVMTPDGKLVSAPNKESAKQPKKKVKQKLEDTGEAHRVLIRPLITEKGSSLGVYNQYVFEVAPKTNKIEVRKAIRKVYGVDPIKVNVINVRGRAVRYGRTEGMTKKWKKAIITLGAGQKIEIQEGL